MIERQEGEVVTLIINMGHNEYVLPEGEVVWEPYENIAEVDIDEILAAPHNQYLWYDGDLKEWGALVRLKGTKGHLVDVFNRYVSGIGRPSGDDDAFDYWPSAMRAAWEFAIDLAELYRQERPEFINSYYNQLDGILEEEYQQNGAKDLEWLADEWIHVPVSASRIIKLLVLKLQQR